jgi:hypothetical protein
VEIRTKSTEPETLRIHRRMYEDRLRDMELNEKPSTKRDQTTTDISSDPAIVQHRDEPAKAAMGVNQAARL